MKTVPISELARAVARGVAAYRRKCAWAEEAELRQEAWLAAVEAARTWQPERGPLEPYALRAVHICLGKWTLRSGRPASAPDTSVHRKAIVHVRAVPIDDDSPLPCPTNAEQQLADHHWEQALHVRLQAVTADLPEAYALLLGNRRGRGRWARKLEEQAVDLFLRIKNDPELRQLWDERPEG